MNAYNLIKLFWVVILFSWVATSTRSSVFISWMLVFTYFLLDQALLIHQRAGNYLSNIFVSNAADNPDLSPRFFQLAFLAISSLLMLMIVARAYSRGPHVFKKISNDLFLFILARVFFGLIVDLASAIKLGSAALSTVGFPEDGGELLVDSLILWSIFRLALCNGKPNAFVLDLVGNPDRDSATGCSSAMIPDKMQE